MPGSTRLHSPLVIASAATVWWSAFAALSLYWAGGGTIGLTTLGEGIESLAADGELWFTALVVGTGLAKLLPALLCISLVRPWGDRFSRNVRLVAVGGMGALSLLYGGANMTLKLLVLLGVITPEELDTQPSGAISSSGTPCG